MMDSRCFEEIGCDELPPYYCSGCGEELDECNCDKESVMENQYVERLVVAFEKLCGALAAIAQALADEALRAAADGAFNPLI